MVLTLNCPTWQCQSLPVPVGTNLGAGNGVAGFFFKLAGMLVVLARAVAVDAGTGLTTAIGEAYHKVPDIDVVATAAETWAAGEPIYFDSGTSKFTNVKGNLSAVGCVKKPKAGAAATGTIELTGQIDPDITP